MGEPSKTKTDRARPFFVDCDLARRLEVACAWRGIHYVRAIGRLWPETPVAAEPVGSGYALFGGAACPVNRAIGLGLGGRAAGDDLAFLEAFYHGRGVAPRVDLCPLADPALIEQLQRRGYRLEFFYSVLVQPLTPEREAEPPPSPVQVREVGLDEGPLWLQTVAQGFAGQNAPAQEMVSLIAPTLHSPSAACFLAWLDGRPAGGAAAIAHQGVVELGSDSTLPAFRRRGVQAALIQARLAAARQAGNDLALALTSPGTPSQRNFERAGFRLAYTKAIMVGET